MKILALETSSLTGSVALLDDDGVLSHIELNAEQRTAQSLAPAIAGQLESAGWQPGDVQLIAVTQGPGSFTGLRIGITTTKTFAYATGAKVIGVNTLDVIAEQTPRNHRTFSAVLDAHRQQLFVKRYQQANNGQLESSEGTRVIGISSWLEELTPESAVTGTGLRKIQQQIPSHVTMAEQSCWAPRAATVGQLAYRDFCDGRRDDIWKLVPMYYRQSAAEEKLRR